MFHHIKTFISRNRLNLSGWKTSRKIVVIESDDWGSVRMPSTEAYKRLLSAGIRVDKCSYNRFDSLASEEDLTELFSVLSKFHDHKGNPPIITANAVVANPDFNQIKRKNFQKYYYEPFTETLKKYPNHHKSFDLWQQGIRAGVFKPQFHGREHLNVNRWLRALQSGAKETLLAFENNLFGISTTITGEKRKSYLAALDFDSPEEISNHEKILEDGITLFERIFGYKPATFIATNYIWHPTIEHKLQQLGIKAIQGGNFHNIPGNKNHTVVRHTLGEKNRYNQIYLIRNAFFEPSENPYKDWVTSCLKDISTAFFWHNPAIICSHRLNYMGYLVKTNRDKNLPLLESLISQILFKWPDVEFMSSDQLANLILEDDK